MRKILLGLLAIGFAVSVNAQSQWCATDHEHEVKMQNDTEYAQDRENFEEDVSRFLRDNYSSVEKAAGDTMIVPLVIHVIHDNGKGNISKEQILDGIRVLNEDYLRINEDTADTRAIFKPYASGVNIQFRLARISPEGECTEGIIRVNNPAMSNSASPRNLVKELSHWPENKYFNVWIVNSIDAQGSSGTVLGYGEFPTNNLSDTYGFVNIHQAWGQIGTGIYGGRTPTHEIGHCLNLYHTFQSGCGTTCSNSGDRVCDTPPTSIATYGCNTNQNLCANESSDPNSVYGVGNNVVDQIENYMSYDACQNMFTLGQRDRMLAAINSSTALQNLISENNLIATGTNDGYDAPDCAPIAAIDASSTQVCQGSIITFTDHSYNSSNYDISWSFEGGDITSSSDETVEVTYDTPGSFDVTLTVTNAQGTSTSTLTDYIMVGSTTPQYEDFMKEEFEAGTLPNGWAVNNFGGVGFEAVSGVGFGDNGAIKLNNRVNAGGQIDELVLPVLNLNGTSAAELTFYYAFAAKLSSNTDAIEFHISTNCGRSWIKRGGISGSDLRTRANYIQDYTPNGNSEWKRASLSLRPYASREYFLVKIVFVSGGGNNLYLDKFVVGDQVGINELEASTEIQVIPNPVNENAVISISSRSSEEVVMNIVDLMGRTVLSRKVKLSQGENRIPMNIEGESSGVYFVQIQNEKGLIQQKFMKQ